MLSAYPLNKYGVFSLRHSTPDFFEEADTLFQQGWSEQSSQIPLQLEVTKAGKWERFTVTVYIPFLTEKTPHMKFLNVMALLLVHTQHFHMRKG